MQVLKDDVKRDIEKAAIKCFKESGYDKASMRMIAQEAGLSVGNLYRYFPNKEALFDFVVEPIVSFFKKNDFKVPNKKKPIFADIDWIGEIDVVSSIMEARMKHREALYILLIKNNGSKYEGAKAAFIDIVRMDAKRIIVEELGEEFFAKLDGLYLKASATAFVEGFLTILAEAEDDRSFIRGIIQLMEFNVRAILRYMHDLKDEKVEFRRIEHEEINRYFDHCGPFGSGNRS